MLEVLKQVCRHLETQAGFSSTAGASKSQQAHRFTP